MTVHGKPIPFYWPELRRLCLRISHTVRSIRLSGCTVELNDVRPYQVEAGWQIGVHAHSFYEAHLFLDGTGRYNLGGERPVTPGTVVCHPPCVPHTWRADSEMRRIVFWFRVEPLLPLPVPAQWPCWPELLTEFTFLLNDAQEVLPGWRDRLQFRMGTLLSRILTLAEWNEPASPLEPAPTASLITVVEDFLRDNLAQPVTMTDIAAHVGVSVSSVSHQFSQVAGEPIIQRLNTLRLARAAELLVETDDPISAICPRVGIADPSYFCRRFRNHFGSTPDVYRHLRAKDYSSIK